MGKSKGFMMTFESLIIIIIATIHLIQITNATACGSTLRAKRFQINTPTTSVFPPTHCSYRITPSSLNVCQLRIDFTIFRLAKPVEGRTDSYSCSVDSFNIPRMNFQLCGNNDGQHIYVPFNVSNAYDAIELDFRITDRVTNPPNAGYAIWSLQVTQIDCPRGSPRAAFEYGTAVERSISPILKSAAVGDAYLIAPIGCLQYYPDKTGYIESFNYDDGRGMYLPNMDYAICFRRQAIDRELRLDFLDFHMNAEIDTSVTPGADEPPTLLDGLNENCLPDQNTPGATADYVFIPRAHSYTFGVPSYFCGDIMANDSMVYSNPPGPFYFNFHSDSVSVPIFEKGFRLSYTIAN